MESEGFLESRSDQYFERADYIIGEIVRMFNVEAH
jgi:hypothetical protein